MKNTLPPLDPIAAAKAEITSAISIINAPGRRPAELQEAIVEKLAGRDLSAVIVDDPECYAAVSQMQIELTVASVRAKGARERIQKAAPVILHDSIRLRGEIGRACVAIFEAVVKNVIQRLRKTGLFAEGDLRAVALRSVPVATEQKALTALQDLPSSRVSWKNGGGDGNGGRKPDYAIVRHPTDVLREHEAAVSALAALKGRAAELGVSLV